MSDHAKSSPLKSYFGVWIALLVGTYLTYAVAKLDLGPYNAAVALIIATTKALLVALFFMHLKGASEKLLKAGSNLDAILLVHPDGAFHG